MLCCAVLCCAVLCCAVLCCAVLCCAVQRCAWKQQCAHSVVDHMSCSDVPCCAALRAAAPRCLIALHLPCAVSFLRLARCQSLKPIGYFRVSKCMVGVQFFRDVISMHLAKNALSCRRSRSAVVGCTVSALTCCQSYPAQLTTLLRGSQ
jgi:hypothetical protein